MQSHFSPASTLSSIETTSSHENLLVLLARLIRHRGYSRDAIVSEQLKRYLPKTRLFAPVTEETLRLQFAKLNIEPKTIVYLTENVIMELHMAHERTIG
jgi:hypothetical protein